MGFSIIACTLAVGPGICNCDDTDEAENGRPRCPHSHLDDGLIDADKVPACDPAHSFTAPLASMPDTKYKLRCMDLVEYPGNIAPVEYRMDGAGRIGEQPSLRAVPLPGRALSVVRARPLPFARVRPPSYATAFRAVVGGSVF